jgi:hypothetical protein
MVAGTLELWCVVERWQFLHLLCSAFIHCILIHSAHSNTHLSCTVLVCVTIMDLCWEKPMHPDIHLSEDAMQLHVPGSSCHGGYKCLAQPYISQPGTYSYVVCRVAGRSVVRLCHKPDRDTYIWGDSRDIATMSIDGDDGSYFLVQYVIAPELIECRLYPLAKPDGDAQVFDINVASREAKQAHTFECNTDDKQFVFCAGLDHNSSLRLVRTSPHLWHPASHAATPRGFRHLVLMLMVLRECDSIALPLMPRELMFLLFEALWASWDNACERAVSSSLPSSSSSSLSSSSSSLSSSLSSSAGTSTDAVKARRKCFVQ